MYSNDSRKIWTKGQWTAIVTTELMHVVPGFQVCLHSEEAAP